MQKKINLNDSYCEHLTAFPGGMQKKMNLKNRHCEESLGDDVAISYPTR